MSNNENNRKCISRREALRILGLGMVGVAATGSGLVSLESCSSNPKIAKRTHKRFGNKVSLLGYGCMRFPTTPDRKIDRAKAEPLLDYAYNHGVNYFDTAYIYHGEESEEFVGSVLKKYPRDSYFLATKMPGWEITDKEKARELFQTQLDRCGVDYFDYYLAHSVSTLEEFKPYSELGGLDVLKEEKAKGRIRRLGFSFHGVVKDLRELLDVYDWDFVQIQLNYYDWNGPATSRENYELLEERGIPVVVMEPVRGGILANLPKEVAKILSDAHPDWSQASWALRFAGSHPGVLTVLSGMTLMDHVVENINTFSNFKPLTETDLATINTAMEVFMRNRIIRCTACRYCMPCPFGVNIPGTFALYNKAINEEFLPDADYPTGDEFLEKRRLFLEAYNAIPESERPDKCQECNNCTEHCPQHLEIPKLMKRISRLVRRLG